MVGEDLDIWELSQISFLCIRENGGAARKDLGWRRQGGHSEALVLKDKKLRQWHPEIRQFVTIARKKNVQ
jgi:hypothetical protein